MFALTLMQRKLRLFAHDLRSGGAAKILRGVFASVFRSGGGKVVDESRIAFETLSRLCANGVLVDVGAHFGGSLAPFARQGWRVFAFEPDPENRTRLEILFGDSPNVTIDSRAVGDRELEDIVLYKSPVSTGISGLSAFHSSHVPGARVSVTTIDAFLRERGLAELQIDFLKIDTEGFDLNVLKGVPWSRVVPHLILCEFEDRKTVPIGYTFHDLARYLQEKGYHLVVSEWLPITEYGAAHQWLRFVRYPCELSSPGAWGNIFAVRDGPLYQSLLDACALAD